MHQTQLGAVKAECQQLQQQLDEACSQRDAALQELQEAQSALQRSASEKDAISCNVSVGVRA